MNFEEFKNQYFDGDEEKAMIQLAYEAYRQDYQMSETREKLQFILDSMDRKTANRYMDFFMEEIRKKPEKYNKVMLNANRLQKLNMSEDEVLSAKKNPFVKKFWIGILIILAGIVVMATLLLVLRLSEVESETFERLIAGGVTLFIGIRSMDAANRLMNIFRFKKVKKYLCEESEKAAEDVTTPQVETRQEKTENATQDAAEDNREEITRAYCVKEVQGFHRDRKSMYLAFAVTSLIIFGLLCLASILFILPAVGCATLCFVMHERHSRVLSAVSKHDYCITTDVCTNKSFKVDSDSDRIYGRTLFFSDGKKYTINMAYKGLYFQDGFEAGLYDSVNVGDACYLLQIGKGKRVTLAFPVKEYRLAEDEFIASGDKYYPVKEASVETILSESTKAQIEDMSSIQKNAISAAETALKKMAKTRKVFVIFSLVVIAMTILGIMFDLLQVMNLFVQPFLFIIPSIPALSALFKSASAIDKVSLDYIGYYKLRERQNASVVVIFLLLADIVAYFSNFVLIVIMHT